MAGQISKANQRQSQKNRSKGMKYVATRSHTIKLSCPNCNNTKEVPSQDAYRAGGNVCGKCRIPAVIVHGVIQTPAVEHKMSHVIVKVVRTPQVRKAGGAA